MIKPNTMSMMANNITGNDTTQSTGPQDPNDLSIGPEMSDDDIAATLGLMTTLGDQQHSVPEDPNQPADGQPQAPTDQKPQEDLAPKLDALQKEVDDLKKELKKKDSSVEDMKKMIEDALKDDAKE